MASRARAEEALHRMSVEEFLEWEDGTDTRYELIDGAPVAMVPPLLDHGELAVRVAAALQGRVRAPCRVISEVGVRLPNRSDNFYQADIGILCGPRRRGERYAAEPTVLIEVLSPSTETHDRGRKAPDYRTLSSVQEIVLLSAEAVSGEVWRRTAEGWTIEDLRGAEAMLRLPSVDIALPLGDIYGDMLADDMGAADAG